MLLVLCAVAVLLAALFPALAAWSRAHPPRFEVAGRLAPCPASPNCVNSLAGDPRHAVAPLAFDGASDEAWGRLRGIVLAMPGTSLAEDRPGYLRVEFRSPLLGFVDDGEFLLDAAGRVIHVRSASRVGWSDRGVNRNRITTIARLFTAPHP
jgi:uncharacterized protein (DUF1499 family)